MPSSVIKAILQDKLKSYPLCKIKQLIFVEFRRGRVKRKRKFPTFKKYWKREGSSLSAVWLNVLKRMLKSLYFQFFKRGSRVKVIVESSNFHLHDNLSQKWRNPHNTLFRRKQTHNFVAMSVV